MGVHPDAGGTEGDTQNAAVECACAGIRWYIERVSKSFLDLVKRGDTQEIADWVKR